MAARKGMNPHNIKLEAKTQLLREQALKLRAEGYTLSRIADALGLKRPQHASKLVQEAYKQCIKEPAEQLIKLETARLDLMWNEVMSVLRSFHPLINNGSAVLNPRFKFDPSEHEDGSIPEDALLRDTGPVLASVDKLLKIQERRARLLGLDAPKKTDLNATVDGTLEVSEIRRTIVDPNNGNS